MLEELKQEANYTLTENGALTYASSMNSCVDVFSGIGAWRHLDAAKIIKRFERAYLENSTLAMKCLFFARDVRGGLGERRTFRIIMTWLAVSHTESVVKNVDLFAEYGRFDDLLTLLDTPCKQCALECIAKQLKQDCQALNDGRGNEVSLLGKWLPSINASNVNTINQAKRIAGYLKLDYKSYRKLLTKLRQQIRIIENNLRQKDYSFDYAKQPSKAMFKYREAFLRNDSIRYKAYLADVKKGATTLHTQTLTPYDIIAPICNYFGSNISAEERLALDTTWNAQENFTNGENALVVVDGSGSMYGGCSPLPAAVAQSLAIYFAERNTGHFKNYFITFSTHPRLVEIKGKDIVDKVQYCMGYNEVADTNLQKVFELILATAVKHKVPQNELPTTIYIISDMEFNYCTQDASLTNFTYAKKLFAEHGYKLPKVVFWNVDARNAQVPVTQNEQGVALVSGCSPQIFGMLKAGEFSPVKFMLDVLNSERYSKIVA